MAPSLLYKLGAFFTSTPKPTTYALRFRYFRFKMSTFIKTIKKDLMPTCSVSQKEISIGEAIQGKDIRPELLSLITADIPTFNNDSYISLSALNSYRRKYFTRLISQERGSMDQLDQDVLSAIRNNSLLSDNIKQNETPESNSLGERIADKVATFGGSWTFIFIFFFVLTAWMFMNITLFHNKGFDPYPFILLNLILSCIAAIQAPIIMMSQNRQANKDRIQAENDYKINLKAELEIKLLSEKIDHLLLHQNKKLLEIQEVQIDYLEDLELRIVQKIATSNNTQ